MYRWKARAISADLPMWPHQSSTNGTTVLFVSHSLDQIRKMCNRVVWLERGRIQMIGKQEVCDKFEEFMSNTKFAKLFTGSLQMLIKINLRISN